MNHFLFTSFSSFVLLSLSTQLFGQEPTPAKMTSTTQPSSAIKSFERPAPVKNDSSEKTQKESLPSAATPPKLLLEEADYLHPGILVNVRGRWEGSDHFLNLSNNIGVYASIIKPETEDLDITENFIKKEVENILTLVNIKPVSLVTSGKPPLPAFQIQVFVYPIDKGYAAFCEGRLFESVTLDRFKMESNMAFQAITWEKQHLIVSPKDQFADLLTKTVQDIAKTFAERYQAYERIKKNL